MGVCVCVYGLRIGDGCGVEVIHEYLEMYGTCVLDNFSEMGFFERNYELEMDGETHSKVDYWSCWEALGIAQTRWVIKG